MQGPSLHPVQSHRVAVLDIGTVTVRLAVADVCDGRISELARLSQIVQLGEGVAQTGLISEAALARLDAMLAQCEGCLERLSSEREVERTMALATSVARDARNAMRLGELCSRHGFSLEVISGTREAGLTFGGMAAAFGSASMLACDVGGGSTELIFGDAPAGAPPLIRTSESVDVGARRATDLFLASDPPRQAEIESASAWATEHLAAFFEGLGASPSSLVATAGVATTLVAVRDRLGDYRDSLVHGKALTLDEVDGLIARMAALDAAERAKLPGLQPQRAGVIVGGAIVQRAVIELSGLASCTVSTQSLLEGALREAGRALGG